LKSHKEGLDGNYYYEENVPSVSGQTVVVVYDETDGVVISVYGCDVPLPTKDTKISVMHFIGM
jgi:hypothetical protein